MRDATRRRSIPERRSAHAVSAMPPAPAAANRRVAASPASRDLVAGVPADARGAVDEDGAEQRDVAAERADLEHRRAAEPPAVALAQPLEARAEADQLRQSEVQERDDPDHEDQRGDHPPAGDHDARHLLRLFGPLAARCCAAAGQRAGSRRGDLLVVGPVGHDGCQSPSAAVRSRRSVRVSSCAAGVTGPALRCTASASAAPTITSTA